MRVCLLPKPTCFTRAVSSLSSACSATSNLKAPENSSLCTFFQLCGLRQRFTEQVLLWTGNDACQLSTHVPLSSLLFLAVPLLPVWIKFPSLLWSGISFPPLKWCCCSPLLMGTLPLLSPSSFHVVAKKKLNQWMRIMCAKVEGRGRNEGREGRRGFLPSQEGKREARIQAGANTTPPTKGNGENKTTRGEEGKTTQPQGGQLHLSTRSARHNATQRNLPKKKEENDTTHQEEERAAVKSSVWAALCSLPSGAA